MRKPKIRAFAAVVVLAIWAASSLTAQRPQSFEVRDVQASDVRSISVARNPDGSGWVETIVYVVHTTTGVPLRTEIATNVVDGPPGVNQITALINARLAVLDADLDVKFPPSGIPTSGVASPQGGGKP